MKSSKYHTILSGGTLFLSVITASSQNQLNRPNILFILADDLGYTDVNCFAGHITGTPAEKQFYETPNIDRLAKQGISFSQAYSCPLCSPTRSSILTGKYASRLGFMTATAGTANTFYIRGMIPGEGFHEQDCYWEDKTITNPQALLNGNTLIALPSGQPQDHGRDEITLAEALKGYHSGFLGKWHLGGHGSEGYQPHDQGFEEIAYFDAGGSPYFNWQKSWDRREKIYPKMRQLQLLQGKSGESLGIEYLTDDLTQRALNYIESHAGRPDGMPFFLYFCEFAVHGPWQAPDSALRYFETKPTKGWKGQTNATYAAMIKQLDLSVGKILDKLEETGISGNTIVVFMSDNGGITFGDGKMNPPLTTNSPLAGQKANLYEGGIRVPLIISYPGKVKGHKWCHIPVDCNDLFPTLLELAGEPKPSHKIDGQSLATVLKDVKNKKKSYTRDTFFWHYPLSVIYLNREDNLPFTPHSAVRKGDYKLIFDWYGRLRLFDIRNDISEKNNLAKTLPDKTRELFAILMDYLENNVEKKYWPRPNPDYDPATEVRKVPFVDLYKAYKEGKDIVQMAN